MSLEYRRVVPTEWGIQLFAILFQNEGDFSVCLLHSK
jgi:hypothetical protein